MAVIILLPKRSLITIDVFYYFPDYPLVIQEFMWQCEDITPEIPRTRKFLKYWEQNIDGLIKEVILSGLNPDGGAIKFQHVDEILSL